MKQLFSIGILCIMLLQTFSKCIVFLNYEINKEYISKNLCENRNRPLMHCNGQCYLNKQLNKEEKREQSPFNPIKEKIAFELFSESKPVFFLFDSSWEIEKGSAFVSLNLDKHVFAIFHPPRS